MLLLSMRQEKNLHPRYKDILSTGRSHRKSWTLKIFHNNLLDLRSQLIDRLNRGHLVLVS